MPPPLFRLTARRLLATSTPDSGSRLCLARPGPLVCRRSRSREARATAASADAGTPPSSPRSTSRSITSSGVRDRGGPAIPAVRERAQRRGGPAATGTARGRRSGAGAGRAAWVRRPVRCSPCCGPAIICWRARGSTAGRTSSSRRSSPASGSTSRSSIRLETRGPGASRLRRETRAIFLESPVNPTCRVLDLRPVTPADPRVRVGAGRRFHVRESPVNFRPLEHGADVVIHSTTKFLSGHHDVARRRGHGHRVVH